VGESEKSQLLEAIAREGLVKTQQAVSAGFQKMGTERQHRQAEQLLGQYDFIFGGETVYSPFICLLLNSFITAPGNFILFFVESFEKTEMQLYLAERGEGKNF
jgi:hypothetical protein